MDIAATSMDISQSNVQSALNIGLMKKTMVDSEELATDLINEMLPAAPAPSPYAFDTYA